MRTLLTIPFGIAALLNILSVASDPLQLRSEHIAGYAFLFSAPWAWLLDQIWIPDRHHHWLQMIFGYTIILWIPALLYSTCIWLLFAGIARMKRPSCWNHGKIDLARQQRRTRRMTTL